jgi:hypothetical protein
MKKNAIVYGTQFGSEGIIVCSERRITFIHKSEEKEILRRWYYEHIEDIFVDMEDNIAVIQFYHRGRRVFISNLSPKSVLKIKDFIERNQTQCDCQ